MLEVHCDALKKGLCHCGQCATSELSYIEGADQRASPTVKLSLVSIRSSSFLPSDSLRTNTSYQSPVISQVTTLVPIPEEVQLPSPTTSEDEIIHVLPPRAIGAMPQVSGQQCWTRPKTDCSGGVGASSRFFWRSSRLHGKHWA